MTEFYPIFNGSNTSKLREFLNPNTLVLKKLNISIGEEFHQISIPGRFTASLLEIDEICNVLLPNRLKNIPDGSNIIINYETNKRHPDGANHRRQYKTGHVDLGWATNVFCMSKEIRKINPNSQHTFFQLLSVAPNNIDPNNTIIINDNLLPLYKYIGLPSASIYCRSSNHNVYNSIVPINTEIVRLGFSDNWILQIWSVFNNLNNQIEQITDVQAEMYATAIKEFSIPKVLMYFESDSEEQINNQIEGIYKIFKYYAT